MLLRPETRQIFVDCEFTLSTADLFHKVCLPLCIFCQWRGADETYKISDSDDEFLCSRILFFLTYETDYDFKALIADHELPDSIKQVFLPSTVYFEIEKFI